MYSHGQYQAGGPHLVGCPQLLIPTLAVPPHQWLQTVLSCELCEINFPEVHIDTEVVSNRFIAAWSRNMNPEHAVCLAPRSSAALIASLKWKYREDAVLSSYSANNWKTLDGSRVIAREAFKTYLTRVMWHGNEDSCRLYSELCHVGKNWREYV
jgi:hypothetical protein